MMSDIRVDEKGNMTPIEPINKRTYSLVELQRMVSGYIEMVDLGKYYLVVNEEGKLHHLRPNPIATSWLFLATGSYDEIVGPALLIRKEAIK